MSAHAVSKRGHVFSPTLMPKPVTWVIIANRAGVRIYSRVGYRRQLRLIDEKSCPRGRLKTGELISDRPGQSFYSDSSRRHFFSSEHDAQDQVAQAFVKKIALFLKKSWGENLFDRLVLIAEPRFLGKLRKALGPRLRNKLIGVLDKELIGVSERQLLNYVKELPAA